MLRATPHVRPGVGRAAKLWKTMDFPADIAWYLTCKAELVVHLLRRPVRDICRVLALAGMLLGFSSAQQPAVVDVLTSRYDISRSGANLRETALTTKNVCAMRFGKLFERAVDGDIYAQPLIKTGVSIPGVGVRNVVYIATVNNSLYAFDADSPAADKPFWHVGRETFGDPVPKQELTDLPPDQPYLNFESTVGIVATPVIDADTNTIYVVANSDKNGEHRFRLHAFDVATGREKTELRSPSIIEATYNGNGVGNVDGKIHFKPRKMLNRPGLLLLNGVLYLAFTAHLDAEPTFDYHGWILAYDAKTLKQIAAYCTTPDGIQGGIWQSGAGLAGETRDGPFALVYAVVANGSVGGRNYGESVLQLYPGNLMSVKLAFTPSAAAYLNDHDLDLSTGALLLPDLPFLVACSKEGKCYVIDRADFHLVQEFQAAINSYGGERPANVHGTPVAWRDSRNVLRLYVWGEDDYLRVFQYDGQRFSEGQRSTVRAPAKSMPGGMLAVSANGNTPGSGIVWATVPVSGDANIETVDGIVRAFDAENIGKELWNSNQNSARDGVGKFAKFCPPVIANGKVYVATFAEPKKKGQPVPANRLVVYGLLSGR